jgi:hypothetical protein
MSDDTLPELIDVASEGGTQQQVKEPEISTTKGTDEGEFKKVVSKRKRRQEKMDMEEEEKGASSKKVEDDEDFEDMDEEDIVEGTLDEEPLKKIKFPPVSADKLMVSF